MDRLPQVLLYETSSSLPATQGQREAAQTPLNYNRTLVPSHRKQPMPLDLLLRFIILFGLIALYYWYKRRQRNTSTKVQSSPPTVDPELARHCDWRELGDEICTLVFPDQDPAELKRLFKLYGFTFSRMHEFVHDLPTNAVEHIIKSVFPTKNLLDITSILSNYRNHGPLVSMSLSSRSPQPFSRLCWTLNVVRLTYQARTYAQHSIPI